MIIAAYGQRLYKKDLSVDYLAFMLKECNDAKIGMYSYIARGRYLMISLILLYL